MSDRSQFFSDYEKLRAATPADAELPEPSRTFRTLRSVSMLAIQRVEISPSPFDNDLVPSFDLAYSHTSGKQAAEPTSIIEQLQLPTNTRFYDAGKLGVGRGENGTVVSVNLARLGQRRWRLFPLAHELGHVVTAGLEHKIATTIIGDGEDIAPEADLALYAPAVETLARYAQATPSFADDYRHIASEWSKGSNAPAPYLHQSEEARMPLLSENHMDAAYALEAVVEASAWVSAFDMVEAGTLHPNLRYHRMKAIALRAIATYDDADIGARLHEQTLTYALNHRS